MSPSVFIAAVEPSGDHLGAALISSVKALRPEISITGIGGEAMAKLGVRSEIDVYFA